MPPREVGMQIGRLGPALEHSRGCHVEMSHKGKGPGFTAITSSPTQKYLAECPVITMRGNQYFFAAPDAANKSAAIQTGFAAHRVHR